MDISSEQNLVKSLRAAGMRITPQRAAICSLLSSVDSHPTAQDIYAVLRPQFPSLSLATIYNTLEVLIQVGAVNALGSVGDNTVHYDADTGPHVNLACLVCHRVIDYPSEHIQHVEAEVQSSSGYRLLGARVLYYGICPECQHSSSYRVHDAR
jgi:Fur family transcriptional regulator, peroxide stress response regulator